MLIEKCQRKAIIMILEKTIKALVIVFLIIGPVLLLSYSNCESQGITKEGDNWATYKNEKYKFKIKYPINSKFDSNRNETTINLPFTAGTNLSNKHLKINIEPQTDKNCFNPLQTIITKTGNVKFGNRYFTKQTGVEHAMGHVYDSMTYSTVIDNACVSFSLVLISDNPDKFKNPPPMFDKEKESEVIKEIISSFQLF
jgi:hypothetical protein